MGVSFSLSLTSNTIHNLSQSEKQRLYGRQNDLVPLATNNPYAFYRNPHVTYPPTKELFPVNCPALHASDQLYDSKIHPAIEAALASRNLLYGTGSSVHSWHPIRMGFSDMLDGYEAGPRPVVILILVKQGSIKNQVAEQIIDEIASQLAAVWIEKSKEE